MQKSQIDPVYIAEVGKSSGWESISKSSIFGEKAAFFLQLEYAENEGGLTLRVENSGF